MGRAIQQAILWPMWPDQNVMFTVTSWNITSASIAAMAFPMTGPGTLPKNPQLDLGSPLLRAVAMRLVGKHKWSMPRCDFHPPDFVTPPIAVVGAALPWLGGSLKEAFEACRPPATAIRRLCNL